jgi:hypothetical protein
MAKNREMLKEAIAEAKAVKEMAIANAKAALEEAFTPQLKSMLSLKLQEMEMEEDEYLNEYSEEHEDPETKGRIMTKDVTEEVDLEELLAELELEEEEEPLYEAEEDEDEEEDEATEDVDLSDEEIKDMIEDVLAQMIKDGEIEAGPNFEAEEGEEEEGEEEASEEDEEEVNLEELLKEIEEMEEKEMETEAMEAGLPSEAEVKAAADKLAAAVKSGEISQEDFQAFLQAGREEAKDDIATLNEAEGEPSKEEIQNMLKDDIKDLKREKSVWKIATALGISLAAAGLVTLGLGFIVDAAAVNAAKAFQVVGMAPQVLIGLGGLASGAAAGIASANKVYQANLGIASKEYQLKKMDKELTEAYSTIKSLRSELNEINLLNAKLLYTNKIFKAKNLNENQKVKVLSSFDKAKNVGEVKMVYETLNEGIKVAKTTIKENLGRASKSTVTPTAKQPIVESNDVFKRMQKLAGLI